MTTNDASDGESRLWHNRDFRRFFTGEFLTNTGDSLYTVAVLWLVFHLSGSTFLTGITNAILLLPWLIQIVAGPLVDRLPLKAVLVGSQVIQGIVVLVLPLAIVTGRMSVGVVLAVVPVLMLATVLESPVQATLVPRIVADERLSRANSVLAMVSLGLDMMFEAAGGAIIALSGAVTLFWFDSATFALATALFAKIVVPTPTGINNNSSGTNTSIISKYVTDLQDGIDILRGTVFVELVFLSAVANFATGVTLAILPAFGDVRGGPAVYGFLLGALGGGRLIGSFLAPYLERTAYGNLILVTYSVGTFCWLAAAFTPSPVVAIVLFGIAWVPVGLNDTLTATLNQIVFPDTHLGRVSSIKGTASGATLPLGSLIGGFVAESIGATTTLGLAAFGLGFTGVYVLMRPRIRQLPAVADADPEAFDVTTSSNCDTK